MHRLNRFGMFNSRLLLVAAMAGLSLSHGAFAAVLTTIAAFGTSNGTGPFGLISDAAGNLYGTTQNGGSTGYGTIFKVGSGTNTINTLATFHNTDGGNPFAGLVADTAGNLYGTTKFGGTNNRGTVFKFDVSTNTLNTLVNFNNTNGAGPNADLIIDAAGNLYGTTTGGGENNRGTVFKVDNGTNTITTLVAFNVTNGAVPMARLTADTSGNLYGTTYRGGAYNLGTVFKVESGSNTLTTLASFDNTNGAEPLDGLIIDSAGDLFGTTYSGGANGYGTIFRFDSLSNTLITLLSFNNTNGANPAAKLIADAEGNLFGTTPFGGTYGGGTIFKLAHGTNTLTTLVTFNGTNGLDPYAGLIADDAGNLYGTAYTGGPSYTGTVFKLEESGFIVPEPAILSFFALSGFSLLQRRSRIRG